MDLLLGFGKMLTWATLDMLGVKAKRTKSELFKVVIFFVILLLLSFSLIAFNI